MKWIGFDLHHHFIIPKTLIIPSPLSLEPELLPKKKAATVPTMPINVPAIGFIAVIDSQKGDFSNLAIAYMLARDIALHARIPEIDMDVLSLMVNRIIKDLGEIQKIKTLVETNITNNREILRQLEKSMLLMEFNSKYLAKFLIDGTLTRKDLLDFYMGDDVREKYKMIEKEIGEK
jgi:hypothetical protein